MDRGRIGPPIGNGTSVCCEACVGARRGVARTKPILQADWPNSTRKEDLSLQYLTAVIERPSNTSPCLLVTVYPWPYDRNPSNPKWTAYGLRVRTTESWESARDPTVIPAGRKKPGG